MKNSKPIFGIAAALLALLYVMHLGADGIAGLFGILLADEGTYMLASRNQALFGAAHFFEGDRYRPEIIAPWLHHYGLLTITPEDPIWRMRLGIALQVLSGMALLSWLAGKYHRNTTDALLCFLCLLLNPVLFFYARAGLSEGMQFFLLAILLALLFRLHACTRLKEAAGSACAIGALTAVLFLAKISAVTACIGIGAGLLATLSLNPQLTRKPMLAGLSLMSGLIVFALYFGPVLGGDLSDWIDIHMLHAGHQLPGSMDTAWERTLLRLPYLAYFLSLMPVFALYLLSLLIAADKERGFVFVLCIVALATITAELAITGSDSMGSVRRNFFGLAMLSIVAGFTCREYVEKGIAFSFRRAPFKIAGAALIVAYLSGLAFLLRWAIQHADTPYIIFCALFLLITLIALISAARPHRLAPRRMLLLLAALASLAPMVFQAFFTPRTREDIIAAVEDLVPPHAFITGATAPWYLPGLHRRMIFNNCVDGETNVGYANDINTMPLKAKFYFFTTIPIAKDVCAPKDAADYRLVQKFRLFIPENYGGLSGVSANLGYGRVFFLYEKP